MNLTVIICTYQRLQSLKRTIDSLLPEFPDGTGDSILVVDNAPTPEVVLKLSGLYQSKSFIRFTHEPKQGLSHARNTGLTQSHGELVAYIDDDVIVDRGWLSAMKQAFVSDKSSVCAVAGRVRVSLPQRKPNWLHNALLAYLGQFDLGNQPRILKPSEGLVGCNMAFRKSVLFRLGGFPVALGRKGNGTSLLSNEELVVAELLHKAGCVLTYAPKASLTHVVDKTRLTKAWFRKRYVWQAISDVMSGGRRLKGKITKAKYRQPILAATRSLTVARRKLLKHKQGATAFYLELECLYDEMIKLLTLGT